MPYVFTVLAKIRKTCLNSRRTYFSSRRKRPPDDYTPTRFQRKTLKKLRAQAEASVQADADAIKERIQKEHQSFEYVNKTVEQALWCEVIKFLEQSQQEPEIEQSTETPQESDLSTSSVPASAMPSADPLCSLQ